MIRKVFFGAVFFFFFLTIPLKAFDQVVLWGHKLHSHTHSYIHERFFRAFQHLGYKTLWLDDSDDVSGIDFTNTLFITEGQVDKKIPLRLDCSYILHNCTSSQYHFLDEENRCIRLQVYLNYVPNLPSVEKVEPCVYKDRDGKVLYMPWASDLLPFEIEEMKKKLPIRKEKKIYWIGTIGSGIGGNIEEISKFREACKKMGIPFIHYDPWSHGLSREILKLKTAKSWMAPTICGTWQKESGYIPCRIFINISSGQMGGTNSKEVFDLFEGKIVYHSDETALFFAMEERLKTWSLEEQFALMDFVKEKHTYLNRIQVLLSFLEEVQTARKGTAAATPGP